MWSVVVLLAVARLSASTFDPELHAKFLQMPRDQFIQYFNAQNYSWKIAHHPHLENRKHLCLTTLHKKLSNIKVKHHDPAIFENLPENFDAREKWPNCPTINEIYDQGNCGSCWAFATATVASDRTCISKNLIVRLSEQDFNCVHPICNGGMPEDSFPFWNNYGLVTQECRPYDISDQRPNVTECIDPSRNYWDDKHKANRVYSLSSDNEEMKAELFTNGPIFAGFKTYKDFDDYHGGIYEHQYGYGTGEHAVRIIGYGVENGTEYWLVANSWGEKWGERGFFKIKKYQPELEFENMNYGGDPAN